MSEDRQNTETVGRIAAGDMEAISAMVREVVPGWAETPAAAMSKELLLGGYSGAALYKVSATGAQPPAVVVRVSGAGIPSPMTEILFLCSAPGMSAAALKAWSTGATHENVYCLEDPRYPLLTVTEYVAGRTGDANLMNGRDASQYCRAMGRAVAWMHAQDTGWFDQGPGKEEQLTAVQSVASADDRREILALGRYDTYGKFFVDTLVTALRTEGSFDDVARIGERLFRLLEPDSLMGRLVIGHGDLKYDNTIIRETSTADDPQLVLIDYDRVMRMTAGCDLGTYLHDGETKKYPSLANRRALAEGYIEGCRSAGVEWSGLTRCSVDEVVLDMEAGLLMRSLWISTIMTTMFPKLGWAVPIVREGVSRAADVLEHARTDEALRKEVLEKGSARIVGKGYAIGIMARTLWNSMNRRLRAG